MRGLEFPGPFAILIGIRDKNNVKVFEFFVGFSDNLSLIGTMVTPGIKIYYNGRLIFNKLVLGKYISVLVLKAKLGQYLLSKNGSRQANYKGEE